LAIESPVVQDIIKQVGVWLIIAGLGYVMASMQDRYTASTAKDDRIAMINLIEAAEQRSERNINNHIGGGPHDEVDARLVAIEIKLELLRNSVEKLVNVQ